MTYSINSILMNFIYLFIYIYSFYYRYQIIYLFILFTVRYQIVSMHFSDQCRFSSKDQQIFYKIMTVTIFWQWEIWFISPPGVHVIYYTSPVKRICVFEHSVMTDFNCACPAIQKDQGSGFLSEGSSWHTACMSEQGGSGKTARMCRLAWTFAARIGDK